jgi:adenine C2-methylase RlmN of 23S rRNA A2503 and tRNA A37
MVESRFVRRRNDYFIAYLSAQTGCKQACRFCHLTATGQTDLVDVPREGLLAQAEQVLDWYTDQVHDKQKLPAEVVHFSFMARGEPLASKVIQEDGDAVCDQLSRRAIHYGLLPRIVISTIMPQEIKGKSLVRMFPQIHPNIYYSIYSMDPAFRKKWLPKALPVEEGLEMLCAYQEHTHKIIRLHWAFIEGENDRPEDVQKIVEAVNSVGLRVDVNIVRYNPFSDKHGREPSVERIAELGSILKSGLPLSKVKIVDRVGPDVKASCGMFVREDEAV